MRTVIILGSSRKQGNTEYIVDAIIEKTAWQKINLLDYDISHYDYKYQNKDDDFLALMKKIVDDYDTLIFATPVYWYAMSGIMKMFFDRITDLLTIEKDLGRKLRGKQMAVISCSGEDGIEEYFYKPFSKSAEYLGMTYLGQIHHNSNKNNSKFLKEFMNDLEDKFLK